ncbi:MAG: DUF3747 domain-containing protein [Cyanobacteria bacterium]|nr:DUF3747 domain-containing protein [Cyanobacteria bacterium CG_2015-16_32_12]NCO78284.1 DUF3747 domain-containing protein [Cyanobacteria bacterium CG_2015-22_32_23]NCQ02921.1 DUF3747 domain-containing protein [Cyanobacteria bacterium CG_2015-09_32_10]NCQ41196.1 DUF3747 domain-containing protein [Cyanobacteria bacterium CG_2015-04_32_10]NCS83510.1 DUF3747 domain-containing protein [Cyanobacteria bacterium CG_2015-02_32_10]
MLKSLLSTRISIFALTAFSSFLPFNAVKAVTFQESEVNQPDFIAIAQPYGGNKYNLIVIEQIPNKNSCWKETGGNPVNVDLLLLNFDFSGHCRRSTDANGYSIRYDGQDYGLDILLNLVEKDGNLTLIGINRKDSSQPPIIVGTAQGLNSQPMKIQLNPGWRFTKRTYEGKPLGHVYFSYDSTTAPNITPMPTEGNNPTTLPSEIPPQGVMQEIVAPDIQPQKEIIKEKNVSKVNDTSEKVTVNQSPSPKYNWNPSRRERMMR